MPYLSTHLWFDTQAKAAAQFYVATFKNASIKSQTVLHSTPSGDVDFLTIQLEDQEFALISAGPLFTLNPSISFLVACKTKEEVEELWSKLFEGGEALMPLDAYPFSEKYGWLKDKFGVSWQIMFMGEHEITQKITPTLLFVGKQAGRAEEAMKLYTSIFPDAAIDSVKRYEANEAPDKEGTVKHANFTLAGKEFSAMDSAHNHKFGFNEAISLMVHCETQEEIDHYWNNLSADPRAEQCGWLKDTFGVSWQIVPTLMDKVMKEGSKEQVERVTKAFLKMKKFDLAALKAAYEGN